MRHITSFLLLFYSLFSFSSQGLEEIFQKANDAYNEGLYEEAISLYDQIIEKGQHDSSIYFNLGNSYYKLNNVAQSIYYLEKAKSLSPKDDDILINLAFARNMTIDSIDPLPKSDLLKVRESLFDLFSLAQWSFIIILFSWITVIFFALYLFNSKPSNKKTYFSLSLLFMAFLIFSFSISFLKSSIEKDVINGIIFSKKIEIWAEPNFRSENLYSLHEGTKVQLLETLQDWKKIKIANGAEGWTKDAVIKNLN
ncbi:MAG: tetratricopeptide repeat protein [Bacteroidota bacterium]|nr:tetratricopeptide repeat protein [Bacteroidota bacterium]